jgi:hypothetical protein
MSQVESVETARDATQQAPVLLHVRIAPVALNGTHAGVPSGVITLASPAPAGGVVVHLASDQPRVVAVPDTPRIPEGLLATVFEPLITPLETPTRALITASVGNESSSAEIEVPARAMTQDDAQQQVTNSITQTSLATTNGLIPALAASVPAPEPASNAPLAVAASPAIAATNAEATPVTAPAPAAPGFRDRARGVLHRLAQVRLSAADQPEVAGLARVVEALSRQNMRSLLAQVELATDLLLADPPQVAGARAIRKNLEGQLNEKSPMGILRRNSAIGNVALGLATFVLAACVIVVLISKNLQPEALLAGINASWLLVAGVAGGFGGAVSVMYRINTFADKSAAGPLRLYFTGLLKPTLGVGFAMFVFVALNAHVIPLLQAPPTGAEAYFYAALGFIAGFAEHFTPDLISKAETNVGGNSGSNTVALTPARTG